MNKFRHHIFTDDVYHNDINKQPLIHQKTDLRLQTKHSDVEKIFTHLESFRKIYGAKDSLKNNTNKRNV